MNTVKINCPNCSYEFQVEEVLSVQARDEAKKEYEAKLKQQSAIFFKKQEELEKEKKEFDLKKQNENELFQEKLNKRIQEERTLLMKDAALEFENRIKLLQDENEKRKQENLTLKQKELLLLQKEKELAEQKETMEMTMAKKLLEERNTVAEEIRKKEDEKNELKFREYEKKLDDQKKLIVEMQRKAEQGSMQLQGEVQELVLEELLKNIFPFDLISEVPKGVTGADVMHTIRNKSGADSGKILYESKRTKGFTNEWINKLKNDAVLVKADICVIVSETLPEGIDKIGFKDGVWVCSFHDFKGLVLVLRDGLLRINEAYASQTNKGEKMQMLYDYLMSNEFKLQINAMSDGFRELQKGYIDERNAMERIWKRREKQLEKILLNTNHFIGSIQGIAGSSIPELRQIGDEDGIIEITD